MAKKGLGYNTPIFPESKAPRDWAIRISPDIQMEQFRLCLTGGFLTGGFRERCWHVRERSPSKCCNLPISEALYFVGKSAKRAVTSGWRALTDVLTFLVVQFRKLPVNKPSVRHSLSNGSQISLKFWSTPVSVCFGLWFAWLPEFGAEVSEFSLPKTVHFQHDKWPTSRSDFGIHLIDYAPWKIASDLGFGIKYFPGNSVDSWDLW